MPSYAEARANNIPLHDNELQFAAKMCLISTLGFFVTEKLIKVLEALFKVTPLAKEKAENRRYYVMHTVLNFVVVRYLVELELVE